MGEMLITLYLASSPVNYLSHAPVVPANCCVLLKKRQPQLKGKVYFISRAVSPQPALSPSLLALTKVVLTFYRAAVGCGLAWCCSWLSSWGKEFALVRTSAFTERFSPFSWTPVPSVFLFKSLYVPPWFPVITPVAACHATLHFERPVTPAR